jgi:hypothetical protein
LEIVRELRARGDQIAMLIAEERMPAMPVTQYLVEARKLAPDAKRVLLTAYADTEAAAGHRFCKESHDLRDSTPGRTIFRVRLPFTQS